MMSFKKGINLWSGPRNISTALMYAFAQRGDTHVVDEPFYAHYLKQTGVRHPGRKEVINSQPTDPTKVLENLQSFSTNAEFLFIKNMAHHMIRMDGELDRLLNQFNHLFLIRNPHEMLLSLNKTLPKPTLRDTAYKRQYELFEQVQRKEMPLHVIDSRELLKNPFKVLATLCRRLDISFQPSMLSWQAGPIPEDGVWAKYWYQSVHQSTGFNPYKPKEEELPKRLKPLYQQCKPYYQKMLAHAIKI